MMTCKECGHRTSLDYVAIADECPVCHACPFVEAPEGAGE